MGRKRTKHDVQGAINDELIIHPLDLKENDGLYPFSTTWSWWPNKGKHSKRLASLTIDAMSATPHELGSTGHPHRLFYSEFKDEYPWAVKALGRGLKTICLENRNSEHEGSYQRNAVGMFLDFCRRKNIALRSYEDINFQLICEWRADLRLIEMDSRYKASMFRRFCSVINRIMATDLMPSTFAMPVYSSDAPTPLASYSDAVMFQLISAVTSDIESVMSNAGEFSEIRESQERHTIEKLHDEYSARVVNAYCEKLSFRNSEVRSQSFDNVKEELEVQGSECGATESSIFESSFSSAFQKPGSVVGHLNRLAEREVPCKKSLFPFLLFFLIFAGKNLEVVLGWRRIYNFKGFSASPLECKDPLDPGKCRVRGYKSRGKGRSIVEADDTYVTISNEGVYPVLEFLLWYTEPLSRRVDPMYADSMWLYYGRNKVLSYGDGLMFSTDARKFLLRHEVWDLSTDANGNLTKERILTLDSRRFRKVYASKELLKAVGEAKNHQELHEALANALNHKSFDVTLGSYLSLGQARTITDIATFTLQQKYLDEARKFRGVMVNKDEKTTHLGLPGFFAGCADPEEPDYEGAIADSGSKCQEYDMCLGCQQSRVFEQHLPRIATRVIQYEALRETMGHEQWEIEYGRRHARALHLLASWSDQAVVAEAWESAKSGAVSLPAIIVRG
jgi:hypothetical protein